MTSRSWLLFMDTPRISGGVNHGFLVSPDSQLTEKQLSGVGHQQKLESSNHIAVARDVAQVTKVTAREAKELLVFAGASVRKESERDELRSELRRILESITVQQVNDTQAREGVVRTASWISDLESRLEMFLLQKKIKVVPEKAPTLFNMKRITMAFILLGCLGLAAQTFRPFQGLPGTITKPKLGPWQKAWQEPRDEELLALAKLTGFGQMPITNDKPDENFERQATNWAQQAYNEFSVSDPKKRPTIILPDDLRKLDPLRVIQRAKGRGGVDSIPDDWFFDVGDEVSQRLPELKSTCERLRELHMRTFGPDSKDLGRDLKQRLVMCFQHELLKQHFKSVNLVLPDYQLELVSPLDLKRYDEMKRFLDSNSPKPSDVLEGKPEALRLRQLETLIISKLATPSK